MWGMISDSPSVAVSLSFTVDGIEVYNMNAKANRQVLLQLTPKDNKGNVCGLDAAAAPAWSVDDATKGTVAVVAGTYGTQALFTPAGLLGACNVLVSVPAVNAEPLLQAQFPLVIVPGDAASIVITGAEQ